MATLLQLFKEAAIGIGETSKIRSIDVDPKQKVVKVQAEKYSNPRIFHISDKLLNMVKMIPRKSERVLNSNLKVLETYFLALRRWLAQRLSNPRRKEIHFHTIRHWKATMLYHKTKDALYVKEFLGHKRLDSTLKYINIERALFYKGKPEEFHVRIAKGPEEIKSLLEVGFEYVCEKDGLLFFRKRK